MALSDMIAKVRDDVQDPSAQRWSDQTITNYLNDGQTEIRQFSRAISSISTAVAAATDYIGRPATLLTPYKAFWNDGTNQWFLQDNYGVPEDPNTLQGLPSDVYYAGSNIYIRPVPSAAGTLVLTGTLRPTPMVLDTDVAFYDGSDSTLVAYATWLCLMSDGDPTAANWYQIYETRRTEWSSEEANKNPTTSRIQRGWW